jgi:hypothetical protein
MSELTLLELATMSELTSLLTKAKAKKVICQMSFIVTGNKDFLSKKSQFYGIKNIAIKGRTIIRENTILRGDLKRTGGTLLVICIITFNTFIMIMF